MAEPDAPQDAVPKKKSKLPLLIGVVLALLLGGAVFSPLIPACCSARTKRQTPLRLWPRCRTSPLCRLNR